MSPEKFPFPSNGNAHRKWLLMVLPPQKMWKISIPFKPERKHIARDVEAVFIIIDDQMFPFPSNGKAEHKSHRQRATRATVERVSIPFKRETTSQAQLCLEPETRRSAFRFPSNGNAYRKRAAEIGDSQVEMFRFPSNGKPHRKISWFNAYSVGQTWAFRFPSNGKEEHKRGERRTTRNPRHLFRFPSNGNAHRKETAVRISQQEAVEMFPFPSNGKQSASS